MGYQKQSFSLCALLAAILFVKNIGCGAASNGTYIFTANSTHSANATDGLIFNSTANVSSSSFLPIGNISESTQAAINLTSGSTTRINNNTGPVTFPPN